jgi:hypothetical protein
MQSVSAAGEPLLLPISSSRTTVRKPFEQEEENLLSLSYLLPSF